MLESDSMVWVFMGLVSIGFGLCVVAASAVVITGIMIVLDEFNTLRMNARR